MTKKQRDLFGNKISEDIVIYRTNAIKSKISERRDILVKIRQKVKNPFRDLTEEMRKQFLQYLSVAMLKEECRDRGIKGYSGKKKSELTDLIFMNLTSKELEDFFFQLSENVPLLKEFKISEQKRYIKQVNFITLSDDLLKSDPRNLDAFQLKIETLKDLKLYKDALLYVDKAIEIDYSFLRYKAKIYKKLQNEDKELECYTKLIDRDRNYYPDAKIRKALILIKRRKFDEAIILLDELRMASYNLDVIWPLALFHKARVMATLGKKRKMFQILKEAFREAAFYSFSSGHTSRNEIIRMINDYHEFDKYRASEELQSIIKFNGEDEDVLIVPKMEEYANRKGIKLDQSKSLIKFICMNADKETFLQFDLAESEGERFLHNKDRSIVICCRGSKVMNRLLLNIEYDRQTFYCDNDFSIKKNHGHYVISGNIYRSDLFAIAFELLGVQPKLVDVPKNPGPLVLTYNSEPLLITPFCVIIAPIDFELAL